MPAAIVTPLAPPNERIPFEIAHVPVVFAPSIDQLRPALAGRVSVTFTPKAVPGPLLAMVSVNPIGLPAETDAASAVLVRSMVAGMTRKHSVVLLVCVSARYLEPAAGRYSTRKQ